DSGHADCGRQSAAVDAEQRSAGAGIRVFGVYGVDRQLSERDDPPCRSDSAAGQSAGARSLRHYFQYSGGAERGQILVAVIPQTVRRLSRLGDFPAVGQAVAPWWFASATDRWLGSEHYGLAETSGHSEPAAEVRAIQTVAEAATAEPAGAGFGGIAALYAATVVHPQ